MSQDWPGEPPYPPARERRSGDHLESYRVPSDSTVPRRQFGDPPDNGDGAPSPRARVGDVTTVAGIMDAEQQSIHAQGQHAFCDGFRCGDNPHINHTGMPCLWRAWQAGWTDAMFDHLRRHSASMWLPAPRSAARAEAEEGEVNPGSRSGRAIDLG